MRLRSYLIGTVTCLAAFAWADEPSDQWIASCASALESAGGRGSTLATPYCDCMHATAQKYTADLDAIMTFVATPARRKNDVFGEQIKLTQQVIGGCLRKAEADADAAAATRRAGGPWGDPDVLAAAAAIGMDAAQTAAFRQATGEFVDEVMSTLASLMKKQEGFVERKLRQKRPAMLARMDAKILPVLDEEQQAAYAAYRELLVAKLDQMGTAGRGRRR